MTARDNVRSAASQGWDADKADTRDVFTRDGDTVIVEYTARNGVLKGWVKSADDFDWRKIEGTSKQRKVINYLRKGFIL